MTNEEAIQVIKEKSKDADHPKELAALYAMDDIVEDGIDTWLNTDVSEHLMLFPDIARDLANELIEEGVTKAKLADLLCNVTEGMHHYVKFYEILTARSAREEEHNRLG